MIAMESMEIVLAVGDDESILHPLRLRQRAMDLDCIGKLPQQDDHARAIALEIIAVMYGDIDAVAAACEQKYF